MPNCVKKNSCLPLIEIKSMSMAVKNKIIEEIKSLPDDLADEILDFIQFLKIKRSYEKTETHLASYDVLAKDWDKVEEDEAWKDL